MASPGVVSHVCYTRGMRDEVSSRDLRNRTAEVLRRVEAGERVRVNVNRRPVAELVPLGRPRWFNAAAFQRLIGEAPADPALLSDLAEIRQQTVEAD